MSIGGLNNGRSCVECRTYGPKESGGKERRRTGERESRGVEWKIEVRAGGEGGSGGIVGIGNVASSLVVAAGPEGMLREGMGCQATYVHP